MPKWIIGYGVALAGMGTDTNEILIIEAATESEASEYAREEAAENIHSYEGMYGIPCFVENPDEDDDEEASYDDMEDFLDYWVKPWTPELEARYREERGDDWVEDRTTS